MARATRVRPTKPNRAMKGPPSAQSGFGYILTTRAKSRPAEVRMLPWLERPTLDIDLDKPMRRRFENVPPEAYAAGRLLLTTVMREVPAKARFLAHWFKWRTLGRFHPEAVTLARQAKVD